MTIDEAIKVLESMHKTRFHTGTDMDQDAICLGIEALETIQALRADGVREVPVHLTSETDE